MTYVLTNYRKHACIQQFSVPLEDIRTHFSPQYVLWQTSGIPIVSAYRTFDHVCAPLYVVLKDNSIAELLPKKEKELQLTH